MSQTSELACVYAALILHDDGQDISVSAAAKGSGPGPRHCCCRALWSVQLTHLRAATSLDAVACLLLQSDKMTTLIEAAGVKVEPYWPGLFAKLFETANIGDLITNVGAGAEGCLGVTDCSDLVQQQLTADVPHCAVPQQFYRYLASRRQCCGSTLQFFDWQLISCRSWHLPAS